MTKAPRNPWKRHTETKSPRSGGGINVKQSEYKHNPTPRELVPWDSQPYNSLHNTPIQNHSSAR